MGEQAKLPEVPVRPANEAVVEPQAAIDPKWRTGESRTDDAGEHLCGGTDSGGSQGAGDLGT
ncbi:MAG: hypothetical protein ACRD4O_19670, partial [Bryobacteraceae bacterium]